MSKKKKVKTAAPASVPQAAAVQEAVPAAGRQPLPSLDWKELRLTALLAAAFFLVVTLSVPSSIKAVAMGMMIVSAAVTLLRSQVLAKRVHWLFLAVTLWVTMNGVSTLYALAG